MDALLSDLGYMLLHAFGKFVYIIWFHIMDITVHNHQKGSSYNFAVLPNCSVMEMVLRASVPRHIQQYLHIQYIVVRRVLSAIME